MQTLPRWNVPLLVGLNLAALVLILSWLNPTTRAFWDAWDLATFRLLNQSLNAGHGWRWACAWANCRIFDLIAGCLLFLPVFCFVHRYDPLRPSRGWLAIAALMVGIMTTRLLLLESLFNHWLHYYRQSPTLVLDNVLELSLYFPELSLKDRSPRSFPGDHGCVLFTVTMFIWLRGSWRQTAVAAVIAAVTALPRLISGAHWATDLVVGSLSISLLQSAWMLATPLLDGTVASVEKLFALALQRTVTKVTAKAESSERRAA